MAIDVSVPDQDLLELRSRGDLVRAVFYAAFRARLRALLAEGASRAEAEREGAEEAYAVVTAAFPGWDCTYRVLRTDSSSAATSRPASMDR